MVSLLIDYKFARIKRKDDGTTEAKVRFYEGDITTEDEEDEDAVLVPVTRYRRTGLLREVTIVERGHLSDDEVRNLMDIELAKDATRTPIDEQVVGVVRRIP